MVDELWVAQSTYQFPKTQISFPKHKSISQNANQCQKTGHYIIMIEMAWKDEWWTWVQGLSHPIWRLHVTRASLCRFSSFKMFCGHCGSVVKDTFKFCVNCGNSTSNNTETRSSTSDSISSRKGRAECATAGIATSNLNLISSKPVPTLNTFMNNKKKERKSHFKKEKSK